VPVAADEEIESTVKVMGGEDWKDWICALKEADAIESNAVTVAYSYIGPELTYPMYMHGTIGKAKEHLYNTAKEISADFGGIRAYFSVNKALVTQSSAAIPVVPLYIALLYKVMKEKGLHEGCIEQMYRLYSEMLFSGKGPVTDNMGRLRVDDLEMRPDIQEEVSKLWEEADTGISGT
jgi:enoyl-[acyl-carrier protein] reductase/trans-2-enoyl-CoA reductase (NAD+)